jgi:periplasmic protein TonB
MKLALFFLLSFAVHMMALLVPLSLNGRITDRVITVTILPLELATEPRGISGGGRGAINHVASKHLPKTPTSERTGNATPTPTSVAQEKQLVENLSVVTDEGEMLIPEVSTAGIPSRPRESSASGTGTGGNDAGLERIGAGSGNGFGNGHGSGQGQASATLTQVRYRDTPQPQYPDSARRAGKEGRVLLRVLVDKEGRTKAIEVNTSSGHDLLDRAAAEAIKKWRFIPALAGTKPIETWVKVPIEFQLSNAKP